MPLYKLEQIDMKIYLYLNVTAQIEIFSLNKGKIK